MRKLFFLLTLFGSTTYYTNSIAQCTATGNSGGCPFTVNVTLHTLSVNIITTGGDCTFSNPVIQYSVTRTGGTCLPTGTYTLWTIQGVVTCHGAGHSFGLPTNVPSNGVLNTSNNSGGHPFTSPGSCSGYSASNCNKFSVSIQGPGLPYQTINCTSTPSALAATLDQFDLSYENESVYLNWKTLDESRTSHFLIEVADESFQFQELQTIEALGTNQHGSSYSLTHKNEKQGLFYYRLSEVDIDGNINFLDMKGILIKKDFELNLFPNPVAEGQKAQFFYNVISGNEVVAEVVSPNGTVLCRKPLTIGNDLHEITVPKGINLLRIIENGKATHFQKIQGL